MTGQVDPDFNALIADKPAILFFDGVCNLCNRSIDFLIRRDRKGVLRFGPLQGNAAARVLKPEFREGDLSSIVLADEAGIHLRSSAVLRALKRLGGGWGALGSLLLMVPRPVRDWVYDGIAKRRYRIWGRRDTCRVPSEAERARFVP